MTAPAVDADKKKGLLGAFSPFTKPFWVINGVELFERGAYYGLLAVLSSFLLLNLDAPGWLRGILLAVQFPLLYFLPVVSGALADKLGFKRLLIVSFAALIGGYLVVAVAQTIWMAFAGIVLYSIGAGLFKPMPAAVVAETTSDQDRNFGFAIYYWMINLGAAVLPFAMTFVFRGDYRPYFLASAALSAINLAIILFMWRDLKPAQPSIKVGESLKRIGELRNHPAFVVLLVIYSGFWFMYAITTSFMQNYATQYGIIDPSQVGYIVPANAVAILLVGPIISKLTGKLPALPLMIAGIIVFCGGFTLIGFVPTLLFFFTGIFIFSIGEFLTHPSYLSYVSKISPSDKIALFFGFGFLPIGVGQMLGTLTGGILYSAFVEQMGRPQLFWVAIISVGLVTVAALLIYNMVLTRRRAEPTAEPRRRGIGAAPVLAVAVVLLIPGLVFAGSMAPVSGGEPVDRASDAGGIVGSVLELPALEGTVDEGATAVQNLTLPANLTGAVTFTLTWTDEAAAGPGRANAPDTLKLHVKLANGTIVESEAVANAADGKGEITLLVEGLAPGEAVEVMVEAVDCGDQTVSPVGPLGPLPIPAGGSADTGNAWTVTAAAEVA